ncbi:hypothetical protein V2W30_38715 [Streptomyces sp. Q6]|uniref:Uncharacterized protein n=1 Tax=Streptomyces citrinus TaxID=3118173 RepID=A0ACD5ANR1_9ACTN
MATASARFTLTGTAVRTSPPRSRATAPPQTRREPAANLPPGAFEVPPEVLGLPPVPVGPAPVPLAAALLAAVPPPPGVAPPGVAPASPVLPLPHRQAAPRQEAATRQEAAPQRPLLRRFVRDDHTPTGLGLMTALFLILLPAALAAVLLGSRRN